MKERSQLNFVEYYFFLVEAIEPKIKPFANARSIPTALHSDPSAMILLHTVSPAYLITKRDRSGVCKVSVAHTTDLTLTSTALWERGQNGVILFRGQ